MMQSAKEFISNGNFSQMLKQKDAIYIAVGLLGASLTFLGLFLPQPYAQISFVSGSTILLLTAIYFKLIYFIALEMIVICGHGAILFAIGLKLQIALPILLSLQLLFFYYMSGQLTNLFILIGIAGIAFMSVGFAYQVPIIFFLGSATIATYSMYEAQKNPPAWIWCGLNLLFSLVTLYRLILTWSTT